MAIGQLISDVVAGVLSKRTAWQTTSILPLAAATFAALSLHGAVMGRPAGWRQATASAIKLPLVPLASLVVTAPALLALATVSGVGLSAAEILRLLLATVALQAILAASFAPVVWFFSLGSGYDFMKLLHTGVLGICGIVAACRLMMAVHVSGASNSTLLFFAWCSLWGFCGCQMAWTLRPFLGSPDLPFGILRSRARGMNFLTALLEALRPPRRSSQ